MKKIISAIIIALIVGGAGTYGYIQYRNSEVERGLLSRLLNVEEQLSQTKKDLLGYTTYTDYLAVTKKAVTEQMKFLAAKVDREYVQVENIKKAKFWGTLTSDATVVVKYAVEYSFGYDLKPDNFSVSGDNNAITVTLSKPELVATPAVKIISHEIPNTGILIDEKARTITLDEKLHAVALNNAKALQNDEAVIALCEKKLGEFLHDFLAKQPNVKIVPVIKFAYK